MKPDITRWHVLMEIIKRRGLTEREHRELDAIYKRNRTTINRLKERYKN